MNGIAWVVEVVVSRQIADDPWMPSNSYVKRLYARKAARNLRMAGWRTRVRKYIRQPETRP